MNHPLRTCLAGVLTSCVLAAPAAAQTGPELMLLPWQAEAAEVDVSGLFIDTETDPGGTDVDLSIFDARGRARTGLGMGDRGDGLLTSPEVLSAIGFEYTNIHLNTSDPALPSRLVDVSIAIGGVIGDYGKADIGDLAVFDGDWRVGYTLGLGYAGDVPFHDGDAWYGLGSVFAVQAIDRDTQWIVALSYDGNRSFLPDIPLPSVTYRARYNDELTYALGFPFSELAWRPSDEWAVLLRTALFISITARVEYTPADGLVFFGAFEREVDAFQLDGDDSSRRLIFSQQRLEAGVSYDLCPGTTLTAAAGYAFDQEFERGYDTRDTNTVRDLDDAFYFRVGVEISY